MAETLVFPTEARLYVADWILFHSSTVWLAALYDNNITPDATTEFADLSIVEGGGVGSLDSITVTWSAVTPDAAGNAQSFSQTLVWLNDTVAPVVVYGFCVALNGAGPLVAPLLLVKRFDPAPITIPIGESISRTIRYVSGQITLL